MAVATGPLKNARLCLRPRRRTRMRQRRRARGWEAMLRRHIKNGGPAPVGYRTWLSSHCISTLVSSNG